MRPAKNKSSLHTRAVWSESLLSSWRHFRSFAIQKSAKQAELSHADLSRRKAHIFVVNVLKTWQNGKHYYKLQIPRKLIFNHYHSQGRLSRQQVDDVFLLFFLENRLFFLGDNLHETPRSIFLVTKEKNSKCFLVKFFPACEVLNLWIIPIRQLIKWWY